jgi:hypothetical protein
MVVALHRPSPQVPKPSAASGMKCFDSAASVINLSSKQVMASAIDITWVFLLTLYMSINTILWTVSSYPEVRSAHHRDEVQELINVCLDIIDSCAERWPGTSAASKLYAKFAEACLKSYEARDTPMLSTSSVFGTPSSQPDTNSPSSEVTSATTVSKTSTQAPVFSTPQFGYVFDTQPEQVPFDSSFPVQPAFRSNSIFLNPASTEPTGRRFSYFPPDFTHSSENLIMEGSTPPGTESTASPPILSPPNHLPTPPDSVGNGSAATPLINTPHVSAATMSTPVMKTATPAVTMPGIVLQQQQQQQQQQQPPQQRAPHATFTIPALPHQHQLTGQRPLPPATTVTDWFNPPPPFISPYAFGNNNGNMWNGPPGNNSFNVMGMNENPFSGLPPERQGSLSQSQQIELMGVLENEGMTDIDAYLNSFNYGGGDILGGIGHVDWNGTS